MKLEYQSRYLLINGEISPWPILLMIVLIFISAFFSMSETVFSSLNTIRIKTFIEEGKNGSKKALWIAEHFDKTITTILVGNNLANIALATISARFFSTLFNSGQTYVDVVNTLVMTTIILICGEIWPKSTAKNNPESLALLISGIMYWLIRILSPVTFVFRKINSILTKNQDNDNVSVTNDELEKIFDTMEEEGSIDEDEAEMLQSVLDLHEKKVGDIMTPRVDMIGVDVNDDLEDIKKVFFEHQFSRVPVYEKTIDKIIGILHERDLFTKLIKGQKVIIRKLIQEPMFVSKSMKVDTLIETLQREKVHLAVVSGEFGGTSGIVTMEDALEELVGEIYDEHDDVDDEFITQIKENRYGINADIDLEDLFEELELGSEPDSPYSTLGGWLYDMLEDIPEIDNSFTLIQEIPNYEHDDDEPTVLELKFIVKDIKDRRISYVHLTIDEQEKEDKK